MQDFVFGSMATTERRAAFAKMRQWGVKHLNRMAPRGPGPGDAPELTGTVERDRQIKRVECVVSEPETAVYPLHLARTDWDLLNWSYYQVWQVTLPTQLVGTLVRYQILAHPADGGQPIRADDGATFSYLVSDPYPPAWSRKAVVYQIFPDRFSPGNGRAWPDTDDLNRIHGGAVYPSSTTNFAYRSRRELAVDAKSRIARVAAGLIPDNSSLFLNIGTTVESVAIQLRDHVRGWARRVGDQDDMAALAVEAGQGLARTSPAFAAVVDHAPHVTEQNVVVGGDVAEVRQSVGKGHAPDLWGA